MNRIYYKLELSVSHHIKQIGPPRAKQHSFIFKNRIYVSVENAIVLESLGTMTVQKYNDLEIR